MKKFVMMVSAAAMAVSMPAFAKPDKDNKGGGNSAQSSKSQKMKGNGGKGNKARADNGSKRFEKAKKQNFASNGNRAGNRQKVERRDRDDDKRVVRLREARQDRRWNDDNRQDRNDRARNRDRNYADNRGFCPPGLAKKDNGCMPPGQAKKFQRLGDRYVDYRNNDRRDGRNLWNFRNQSSYYVPARYRDLYRDTPDYFYRNDAGYIYRVNRQSNLVSALIPLLGGGFGVGQTLPTGYSAYNVPSQYRSTYYDTNDYNYRFGDRAIYQVNPRTNTVQNVVALLTGQNFNVGRPLPTGYDMYNVPLQYRDRYYDNDQYNYRYADGNIYQVDPKTQIIQAIVSALI